MRRFFFANSRVMVPAILLMSACGIVYAQEVPAVTPSTESAATAKAVIGKPNPDANGIYHIGDGVSPPVPVSLPDPSFSKQIRKWKMSGSTLVGLTIDPNGKPQDVHVIRSMAEGLTGEKHDQALALDQKAVETAKRYRFRPATYKGNPIAVKMNVEVRFNVF